jgi:hypothetical protein
MELQQIATTLQNTFDGSGDVRKAAEQQLEAVRPFPPSPMASIHFISAILFLYTHRDFLGD